MAEGDGLWERIPEQVGEQAGHQRQVPWAPLQLGSPVLWPVLQDRGPWRKARSDLHDGVPCKGCVGCPGVWEGTESYRPI